MKIHHFRLISTQIDLFKYVMHVYQIYAIYDKIFLKAGGSVHKILRNKLPVKKTQIVTFVTFDNLLKYKLDKSN